MDKLVEIIPRFVAALLQLVSAPVSFVADQLQAKATGIEPAAYFLVISASTAFLLRSPFLTQANAGAFFVAYQVAATLAMTLCLYVAWRLVGGRVGIIEHFIFYAYAGGIGLLLGTLFGILARGVIEPECLPLFTDYVEAVLRFDNSQNDPRFAKLRADPALVGAMALLLIGELLAYAWMLICWPALATAHAASRSRSLTALALAFTLGLPVSWLLIVFAERSGIANF